MKPFFPQFFLTFLLLLPQCFALAIQAEDDLVFDDVGDETASGIKVDPGIIHHQDHLREQRHKDHRDRELKLSKENKSSRVERLWGMPDVTATAGHIFKMKIPKQAFGGNVERYEVIPVSPCTSYKSNYIVFNFIIIIIIITIIIIMGWIPTYI